MEGNLVELVIKKYNHCTLETVKTVRLKEIQVSLEYYTCFIFEVTVHE